VILLAGRVFLVYIDVGFDMEIEEDEYKDEFSCNEEVAK